MAIAAVGAAFLLGLAVPGCTSDAVRRSVYVHVPAACAPDTRSAYAVFYASGDFEPTPDAPAQDRTPLRAKVDLDGLPTDAKMLVADVSTLEDPRTYRGIAPTTGGGDVHVLLWPNVLEDRPACALSADLGVRVDGGLGMVGDNTVLFAGGRSADGSNVPRTYAADLTRGRALQLPIGLASRRLHPTVTRFGAGGLVAGGADPESSIPLGTAEVYADGDFLESRIELGVERAEHAAVVLASGETLLVGGRGRAGALRSLEAIDPKTKRIRSSVGTMDYPRRNPVAVRLVSGQVLVTGGQDDANQPVPDIEIFERDGSRLPGRRPTRFLATRTRSVVPMSGGGALVVLDADDPDRVNVWRISADGVADPVGKVPIPKNESFSLFRGNDDQAILFAGGIWYRFDPWAPAKGFAPVAAPPRGGPQAGSLPLETPDLGLVAWVDDQAKLRALRFSTRSPFERVPRPLLTTGIEGFAPDRAPQAGSFALDGTRGLVLGDGETATLTVYDFSDFTLTFRGAPTVVLRAPDGREAQIGASECLFAFGDSSTLVRRGNDVQVQSGAGRTQCTLPFGADTRLTVAFRGNGAARSAVTNVVVSRN